MVRDFDAIGLQGFAEDLDAFVDGLSDGIAQAIVDPIDTVNGDIDDIVDGVTTRLLGQLDKLIELPDTLEAKVIMGMQNIANENVLIVDKITSSLRSQLASVSTEIEGVETNLQDDFTAGLTAVVLNTVTIGESVKSNIANRITEGVEGIVEDQKQLVSNISEGLESAVENVVGLTTPLVDRTVSIAERLATVLPETLESLPDAFGAGLLGPLSSTFGSLKTFFDLLSSDEWGKAISQIDNLHSMLEDDPFIGPFVKIFSPDGAFAFGAIGIAGVTALVISLMNAAVSSVFAGPLDQSRQASFKRSRPSLLSVPELRELINRQEIGDDDAQLMLQKAGHPDDDIVRMLGLRKQLLGVTEILTLWRRNEISDVQLPRRLGDLGFQKEAREGLETLAFAIPPIQDIILFAVREVWDIETASKLGQYEGISNESMQRFQSTFGAFGRGFEGSIKAFEEYARQAGLSPEWATAYWAAHWRLPGVQTLFEMVHRLAPDIVEDRREDFQRLGLDPDTLGFTVDDLQRTLRAQDFSPFFREKITALSFSPITRVDVRRMHKLGLVSDAELVRRYRELGFSPEDAELMAIFTIDFNTAPEDRDDEETRELTRAQVLDFFQEGHLSPEGAVLSLVDIGYSSPVATVFVSNRQLDILRSQQRAQIKAISERFKARLITFNAAVTQLDALNLPALQKDALLADMEAEVAGRVRIPTVGELKQLAEAGEVTRTEYGLGLLALGFDTFWVSKFSNMIFGA